MKKYSKNILCIVLCAITAVTALPFVTLDISAEAGVLTSADGNWLYRLFGYTVNSICAELYRYTGSDKDVRIPESIDGYDVLKIAEYCFYGDDIDEVAIPGTVASIEQNAFADSEKLEKAYISDSVTAIADNAFDNCQNLTIYCSEKSYVYNYAKSNNIPVSTFVVAYIPNQVYTGNAIKPAVRVTMGGNELSNGSDYTVTYSDNVNVGTAYVYISGINDYKMFSSTANFTIITRSICEASVIRIPDQTYTGSEIRPTPVVSFNGKILREGTEYTLGYSSNINIGTAKITIKGKGNFSGSATYVFNIVEEQGDGGRFRKILELCITALQYLKIIFEATISIFKR